MSEFKREERFIVIKRKHLSAESRTHDSLEQELRIWLDRHLVPTSECVVVESDWPEYETVWAMLAARIEGRATPYQLLEQQVAALRQHKNDYMEAAEGTRLALEAEAQALREERDRIERNRDMWKGQCERQAEKLAALRARVVVPDGYAIVPVELTRDMWVAVNKEDDRAYAGACDHGAQFDWLWKAAIDAAPRLNGKAVSEGLLHETIRSVDDIFWAIHAKPSCQSGVVARCRCILCAGTRLAMARDDLSALLGEGKEVGDVLVRK
ncbi:hypothetical protein [Pseudomonas nitroreducens]|uniref:hypothetical protein n=1 Tax=Pseudomonas nitroreducens TaxID=46680 RepID=UPI0028A588A3|nr:hypothetical protein [Pseudomonas nitroreducens]